jgi:alkyldihydroxyacetonephosphate synthase
MDTLECAVTWDRLMEVWSAVKRTCARRPNTACLVHLSHFYAQGANLYFVFITRASGIEDYLALQESILDQIRQSGAAMSHHHGIGKMTAPWLEDALGTPQMDLLRAIKRHLDPRNIMNPGGTLGLDLPAAQRADTR